MLATREQISQSNVLAEGIIRKHEDRVRRFQNFTMPALGIDKAINPLEILEGADGKIDPLKATKAAMLLENFITKTMDMYGKGLLDETSRASLPAWVKNGLALIAAAQADDIVDRVISVQPMSNRLGRIHYLDVVSERAKGDIPDRALMFDALNGFRGTENLSSEKVNDEVLGAAGSTDYAVSMNYSPVIPGSLEVTDGTQVVRDNGNGLLVGDTGAPGGGITNTIDYISGALSLRFAVATSAQVKSKYVYNIEAALKLPEYGIHLRAEQVEARPRALGASWSQQAVMDFMNDFGIDAEPTIIEAGARLIAQEVFKHVVNELRKAATGGAVVFDNTAPTGVSYRDHLKTIHLFITRLQDLVYEATQTTRPNVMVLHPSIAFAIAFQDGWQGQRYANDGIAGPRFLGRLTDHDIDVFVDPTSPRDQALLTYRGPEFVSTAAIKGDYVPLYKAPVHTRAFRKDFALLSEYALKIIDSDMIATFQIVSL
jgi:hypothetical protein